MNTQIPLCKMLLAFGSKPISVTASFFSFPHLSAGGAEAVLICADAMPAEAAYLVTTGAREEVDVINLQWLHAQGALHGVVLHLGAVGHPIARRQGSV